MLSQVIAPFLPLILILPGGNGEKSMRDNVYPLDREEHLDKLKPLLTFFASFVLALPLKPISKAPLPQFVENY